MSQLQVRVTLTILVRFVCSLAFACTVLGKLFAFERIVVYWPLWTLKWVLSTLLLKYTSSAHISLPSKIRMVWAVVPSEWFEQRTETLHLTTELTCVNVQCSVDTFHLNKVHTGLDQKTTWSPDQFFTPTFLAFYRGSLGPYRYYLFWHAYWLASPCKYVTMTSPDDSRLQVCQPHSEVHFTDFQYTCSIHVCSPCV